jgi:Tfp pilus assembly protein PilO
MVQISPVFTAQVHLLPLRSWRMMKVLISVTLAVLAMLYVGYYGALEDCDIETINTRRFR